MPLEFQTLRSVCADYFSWGVHTTAVDLVPSVPRAVRIFPNFGIHFLASMEPLPGGSGSVLATRLPVAAAAEILEWEPTTTTAELFNRALSRERSIEKIIAENPSVPALEDDPTGGRARLGHIIQATKG
jgi:hypothetical protein